MSEMMLWLSGADRDVLSHCERERSKFVAMGGTVLTTAALAFLAATFTIHEFLHAPLFFALVLGLGWAFAIMNLDRWLLISIRRQATPGRTIAMAAPRVFLAILIGAVIAHPLVLRVFDKEIEAQAGHDRNDALEGVKKDLRRQFAPIPQLDKEAETLRSDLTSVNNGEALEEAPEYQEASDELRHLERREANARHAALCELDGRCGSDKQGAGPAYRAKNAVAETLHSQVVAQQERVAAIRERLKEREGNQAGHTRQVNQRSLREIEAKERNLVTERDAARAELREKYKAPIGLLDRVVALNNLTLARPEMLTIEILLFLFILAIDSMPAVAKVLMSLGKPSLYETVQAELEEADTVALKEQTKAHAKASEIEAGLLIDEAMTRKSLTKEVQDDLVRQSVEAMREAGEKFIALWRKATVARVPRMVRRELERNGIGDRVEKTGSPPPAESKSNGGGPVDAPQP
jgi:Domain of unknown function (DUF4407)